MVNDLEVVREDSEGTVIDNEDNPPIVVIQTNPRPRVYQYTSRPDKKRVLVVWYKI